MIDFKAARAATQIVDDLKDRRGLRQEWDQIDEETQREILAQWTTIIARIYGNA